MVRPLHDFVLVKPIDEEQSQAGIITVDTEAPQKGEVIAIGDGIYTNAVGSWNLQGAGGMPYLMKVPMSVKQGDKVFFKRYSKEEIKVEGESHFLIANKDILAVIE